MPEQTLQNVQNTVQNVLADLNFSVVFVFIVALAFAYVVSKVTVALILKLIKVFSKVGERAASKPEQALRLRRAETYLSVSLALVRAGIFAIALIAAWQYTNPATTPVALIGASTVFIVLAGATIVPTLRDLTAGSIMIIERWYNVGDFVTLEPFANVSGVVERMTLRSTKLRNINGEAIWLHNQHIQGARVTPRGARTMAIDLFVTNAKAGEALMQHLSETLPVGPTMLVKPLKIVSTQKLNDNLWHITATCQISPAREWLIEDFAAEAIKEQDKKSSKKVIAHGPIVRYADEAAEKRFKRTVAAGQATTTD